MCVTQCMGVYVCDDGTEGVASDSDVGEDDDDSEDENDDNKNKRERKKEKGADKEFYYSARLKKQGIYTLYIYIYIICALPLFHPYISFARRSSVRESEMQTPPFPSPPKPSLAP